MSMSGASSSSTPTQLENMKANITLARVHLQKCKHAVNNEKIQTPISHAFTTQLYRLLTAKPKQSLGAFHTSTVRLDVLQPAFLMWCLKRCQSEAHYHALWTPIKRRQRVPKIIFFPQEDHFVSTQTSPSTIPHKSN